MKKVNVAKLTKLITADIDAREKLRELDDKRDAMAERSDVFHAKYESFKKVENKISELMEKRLEIRRQLETRFGVTLL